MRRLLAVRPRPAAARPGAHRRCSSASASGRRSGCPSTPCPTSPTSRCRSTPTRRRSPRSRSSGRSRCPSRWRCRACPDVEEVRSLSKFGLSQVTVVFDDHVNIYFARQLVQERLQEAREQIPPGLGTPEMGPISSGLGEIFQYSVEAPGARPDGAADPPGLGGQAAAPLGPRRRRGELLRRPREAVPGPRPAGGARQVQRHAPPGVRGARRQQRQQGRRLHRQGGRAVRDPRRRPGPGHRPDPEHRRGEPRRRARARPRPRRGHGRRRDPPGRRHARTARARRSPAS